MNIDCESVSKKIADELINKLRYTQREKYVVGMSGGIDSSLSATLAVNSVGSHNVVGIVMPYKTSSNECMRDAVKFAEHLKIQHHVIEITDIVSAFTQISHIADVQDCNDIQYKTRIGNIMARIRMSILYDFSNKLKGLVLGTGNKTEYLLGYTTLWGDMCCDINPLGELYKTHVIQIAKFLGLPESIINRAPSADLWPGQTDEGEIGISYERCDKLLELGYDYCLPNNIIREFGFSQDEIDKVGNRINMSVHKRDLFDVVYPFDVNCNNENSCIVAERANDWN